ncbi:hypothetical protein C6P46_001773 [Rhodotorula mucilaginosa]|uniref:Uncharacterized protein n=1 Tax=Rhodotorula mucilaginosa TaxID=5537 RepID=A0A9P6VSH9_RHOMI|nr:hypothetical protein C6P46_001773 [Rhodotorula mucilaginosa]TKA52190.1 hypothetical protein B0A53_05034 [Rhodotorula sp. CCFEE 5036]
MDCFPDARNPLSCRRGLATSSSSTTALLESTHNPSGIAAAAALPNFYLETMLSKDLLPGKGRC